MRLSARRAAVAGVITGALVLSACGGGGDEDDPEAEATGGGGGSISVRGCNPENPLIPVMTNETCGGDILDQLFSKLVRYDPETAEPSNEIAESIEPNDDNTVYTITLKDGWTFHDGTPITAESFVNAWNWGARGENGALSAYFYEPIQGFTETQGQFDAEGAYIEGSATTQEMSGLTVIDDSTFEVALVSPQSSFPLRLGYTAFSPLPESFFDDPEAFGAAPVGSGPFQFESWEPNIAITLGRYEDYPGDTKPQIDEAVFKIYDDDNAAYSDLLGDNLDIMPQLPTAALAGEAYKTDLSDRYIEREIGVFQGVSFAPTANSPELENPMLRHAISMAIDRQAIIDTIFEGTRTPADGWVSPVVDGFEPGACGEFCTFDPDAAVDLLAQAGGFTGTLTISYNGDADHKPWVDATCNSIINTLGIQCLGAPEVDFATFRTKINDRQMTGMYRKGWQMDYPAVENFLVPIYATGAGSNDNDYSNPEFDAALQEAATLQGDDASAKYSEAERMLAEDMPLIPLWHSTAIAGYSSKVDNVKITPFSTVDLLSVTTTG